jgi:hypothetical protein
MHCNANSFEALLVLSKVMSKSNGKNHGQFDSGVESLMAKLETFDFCRIYGVSDCDFAGLSFYLSSPMAH